MISSVQRSPTMSSVRATGQDGSRLAFAIGVFDLWFYRARDSRAKLLLDSQYRSEMEPPGPGVPTRIGLQRRGLESACGTWQSPRIFLTNNAGRPQKALD